MEMWFCKTVRVTASKSIGLILHARSISAPATDKDNPNQVFSIGDGLGLFICFKKSEDTHFQNGVSKHPKFKPREQRKLRLKREDNHENIKNCESNIEI